MHTLQVRLMITSAAMIAIAGCAQQPPKPAPSAPTKPTAMASLAAAPASGESNGISTRILEAARNDGYRPSTVDGKTLFCRTQIPIGSNLPVKHCVDAVRLRFEVLREQQQRQQMYQQKPTVGSPSGGGN